MTAITIKIFAVFLAAAVCCNCQSDIQHGDSSFWAKLQISPDPLSTMKYGNFLIEIYEHANNKLSTTTSAEKKYFYSPLALLDNKSAVSTYNKFTKKSEMRFRIEMWNDKVENEVVKHLNKIVGQEIQSDKVRVIPFEKVILSSNVPTEDYSLSPAWTNYKSKSKTLWFSLTCYDRKVCDELANEMRSDPKHLDHLKLLYSFSSQTSQTKQATISFEGVTSGQMVFNLLQKFGDKNEIFLTANDEKKMLAETATNIRMETFDDSEVGSPDAEIQIFNILKDMMVASRTTIKEENDKMWDSVFWNDDNYRPDRTTKSLNEIINKLDTETQKKLADMFKIQHNYDANGWADVGKISSTILGKMANDSDISQRVEISKDVENLLQESRNHVEWDGEKFVPKPLRLSRINLDKFRDSQSFQDRNVRVRYTNAELSAPIKVVEHAELTITDEWSNFKEELKATAELLNTTVMDLVKMSAELINVKNDLTSTRIDLTETKQELEKTRINVDYLSIKLNATEKKLAEMKIENWSTELIANSQRLGHEIKVAEETLKKELRELLNTTVNNSVKTSTELINVKKDLNNTRTDLTNKLEETKFELERTRASVNYSSTKLNVTEKELAEMKIRAVNLSTELKTNSQRLGHELKVAEDNLRKELRANLNQLETATSNLALTRTELSSTKSAVADLTTKFNARTSEIVDIGKMPSSCLDLQRMGHKLSGFFSVKGSKKMEMIYCDFNSSQNDKQKWIGYADVKSAPVHFYVQRNSKFNTMATPIPFELARINEGNAINLTSGKFTAPRPGIYFFSFSGLATFPASSDDEALTVGLYLNGDKIGSGRAEEANTVENQWSPLSTIQSTLNLKSGDQVWMMIWDISSGMNLYDYSNHYTHFTGFMLEEEIVASL